MAHAKRGARILSTPDISPRFPAGFHGHVRTRRGSALPESSEFSSEGREAAAMTSEEPNVSARAPGSWMREVRCEANRPTDWDPRASPRTRS